MIDDTDDLAARRQRIPVIDRTASLSSRSMLIVNDAAEELTAVLGGRGAAPTYSLAPSKERPGCMRLVVEVDIDIASLNAFAEAPGGHGKDDGRG